MSVCLLTGCTGIFEYELNVSPVGGDMVVLINGTAQETIPVPEGYMKVAVSETFENYQTGRAQGEFMVHVYAGDQLLLEETFKPGLCARVSFDTDWERETLFVGTMPQYLGLSGYECVGGSQDVKVVVD